MANHELSEQEIVRRNSMNALRERGIEPYPAAEYPVTGHTVEIKENFKDGEEPLREASVAGFFHGTSGRRRTYSDLRVAR